MKKNEWKEYVSLGLYEIASLDFQKNIWDNKLPGYQSSYDLLCEDFGVMVNHESMNIYVEKGFLSSSTAERLLKILDDLDNFEYVVGTDSDYELFWAHPQWLELAERARKIFNEEFRDDFMNKGKPRTEWLEKWPI